MKFARGPRPLPIHLFALVFVALAGLGLYTALDNWLVELTRWVRRIPVMSWNYDRFVIAEMTEFTIALIPVLWIYILGASRARWVVLFFGLIKLLFVGWAFYSAIVEWKIHPIPMIEAALICAGLALLFTHQSTEWLARQKEKPVAQFE